MKKIMFLSSMIFMFMFNFVLAAEVPIDLSVNDIKVDGKNITNDTSENIYLQNIVETHSDVEEANKNIENKVITITKAGTYRISGTSENTQIRVETTDEEDVILILDNANITCKTAPAILIKEAYDEQIVGKANVKIVLENENVLNGSHVAEYYDSANNKIKHDAAISSIPSLVIEGTGSLLVNSDNEGIESKMHLTINGGIIEIFSEDDALNASEDGVSHITINDGSVYAIIGGDGGEGDGIDSNGYITINGGFIVAQAHSSSQDSGLDADLGITINGGSVIATGNMYEGIDETSKQQFMQMYFSESQNNQNLIVITNQNGTPVLAFKPINSFTILECSTPDFKNGTYYAYVGGDIQGVERDGVYTEITSYEKGSRLSHTGTMNNNMRPGNMGGGMFPENGGMQRPNEFDFENLDFTGITLPEGVTEEQITEILKQLIENNFSSSRGKIDSNPNAQQEGIIPNNEEITQIPGNVNQNTQILNNENMQNQMRNPNMGNRDNGQDINESRSYEFVLSETEHVYRGVAAIQLNQIENSSNDINISDNLLEINNNQNLSIIIICLIVVVLAAIVVLVMRSRK